MQYLLILQKFTILELEVAVVVVGDRFLQLKEASEETDLGKEYLTGTIGKIYKNELDTRYHSRFFVQVGHETN